MLLIWMNVRTYVCMMNIGMNECKYLCVYTSSGSSVILWIFPGEPVPRDARTVQRAREVGLRLENFEKSGGIQEQALHCTAGYYIHTVHIVIYIHTYIHTYAPGARGAESHHPEQQETGISFRREATQPKQCIGQCMTHTCIACILTEIFAIVPSCSNVCMYVGYVCGQWDGNILEGSTAESTITSRNH